MDNLKTSARAALVVAIALMAVSGMFAGSAAATVTSLTASNPGDVAGANSDTTQVIADGGNTLDFASDASSSSVAIKIDISDLVDAGVDISNAEVVDANGDSGFAVSGGGGGASDAFSTVDTQAEEIHLVVSGTDDANTVNIDELELAGLDTSSVGTAQDLEYVVRADDQNAGDFGDSGFTTDAIDTTNTFNIATIEVENLATGEQTSVTTMPAAITEANDPTSGAFSGSAGDQVEIRPDGGTYTFDSETITDDNTRIVPLDGADVTFQNNDGGDTLTVNPGISGVEISGITFDQASNDDAAVTVSNNADNVDISDNTFTNIPDTDAQPVIGLSDGAATVTIDNNEFTGDGAAATAIDGSASDDGGNQLDLTVTNNNITGFDDPDGTNGEAVILANDISAATIENNNFENNDQHVDDEAGITNLNTVFADNDFAEQYVAIENVDGDIQEAIYGDLDTAEAVNSEIDAAASGGTVTIAGQHTVTAAIDLANNGNDGLTVTAAGSGATIVSDNDPVFALSSGANNIEVSGLTFDLSNGAHGAIDDAAANFAGLSVTDNTFNGANGDAVVVDLSQGTYDAGLTVNDNTFDSENDYQAISVNGAGLSGTDAFEVNRNSINDADGTDAIALGVLGDNQIDLSVQNNEITNQTNNNAISLDPDTADTVTITDNTLTGENDGAGTGLSIIDAGDDAAGSAVTVSDNAISGFDNEAGSGTAVSTEAADVSFSGNSLVDNAVQFSDVDGNYDEQAVIDNNNISPVVLALDQRGGDIQNDELYGTVAGGVNNADGLFLDVGPGTYEEDNIIVANDMTIDGSGEATLTTSEANPIFEVQGGDAATQISNLTFAPADDTAAADVLVTGVSGEDLTIENNIFEGPGVDNRQGVTVSDPGSVATIAITDNEFENYAQAVEFDGDGDGTTGTAGADDTITFEVVRNTIANSETGVNLASVHTTTDDNIRVHFNDIVDNSDGVDSTDIASGDIGEFSIRANWWGAESGPSGDFSGNGDAVVGDNTGDLALDPWLSGSVDTLPTDQYVVVADPVSPISDDTDTADVLVAALDDGLAQGEDEASTLLLGQPAGALTINEDPGATGHGLSAADPLDYTITSTDAGDYTLTAANTNDNIPDGSATQTFTGEASDVTVEVDSDTLVADDETTINATATLVDDNGNAVDRGGTYGVTWLVSGSNDAGVTRVTEEDFDTTTPDSEARLEISAENAGVGLTITAQADTGGYSDSASVTTVEPAATNFTLDLVEGPTTITQNESYSATLNVTNEGDAAGTQTIEYDLEDSTGLSQIDASEEVSLDAGNSTEITFEVPASATTDLETGNYTHVFASDDDELTVDAEVVEEGADETALARFDSGGDGTIDRDEAVSAIVAYNTDGTVGGEPVTRDQAVNVIIAYNTGASV